MTLRPHNRLSLTLLLSAALALVLPAVAAKPLATADDFFHGGAMHYLSNNIPAALDVVTNGLQRFPMDEKLKKLEELLKQQQKQQQQNQNDSEQQKQDESKQQDQKQDQKRQQDQQQNKKDQQQPQPDKNQPEPKPDQERQGQQPKPDEKKNSAEPQKAGAAPQSPNQMTPEQAQRVLDSLKGDEQVLPLQQMETRPNTERPVKDW
jgi:outer membrane biosynthesis protein TonB